MKKYQVIGGQYTYRWYGESDTLREAKIIAARNEELWDNHMGWHKPCIFTADTVMDVQRGDGWIERVPNPWAEPVC